MVRIEDMNGNSMWVNPRLVVAVADILSEDGRIMVGCCSLALAAGIKVAVREGKDSLAMRLSQHDMLYLEGKGAPS